MKKSNILIAAVAVIISAATAARAEKPSINFDGGSMRAVNFLNAVKDNASVDIVAVPAPTPAEGSGFDIKMEEDELNRSIGTAIKDCEKKEFAGLKTKFEKLLTKDSRRRSAILFIITSRHMSSPVDYLLEQQKQMRQAIREM